MYFNNEKYTIELIHQDDVSLDFIEVLYKYLQTNNYELIEEIIVESDQHFYLLNDIKEGTILVIMNKNGSIIDIYNQAELKSQIRKEKIANLSN